MRITLESDYALRILTVLAKHDGIVGASALSEETSVTPRFTLKILHKLVGEGIVSSFKGVMGGYRLLKKPEEITLKRVIESIDGPIAVARCLENSETCSYKEDKAACIYHHIFDAISLDIAKKLGGITIADVLNQEYKN